MEHRNGHRHPRRILSLPPSPPPPNGQRYPSPCAELGIVPQAPPPPPWRRLRLAPAGYLLGDVSTLDPEQLETDRTGCRALHCERCGHHGLVLVPMSHADHYTPLQVCPLCSHVEVA